MLFFQIQELIHAKNSLVNDFVTKNQIQILPFQNNYDDQDACIEFYSNSKQIGQQFVKLLQMIQEEIEPQLPKYIMNIQCNKQIFNYLLNNKKTQNFFNLCEKYQLLFKDNTYQEKYKPALIQNFILNSNNNNNGIPLNVCSVEHPKHIQFEQNDILIINVDTSGIYLDNFAYDFINSHEELRNQLFQIDYKSAIPSIIQLSSNSDNNFIVYVNIKMTVNEFNILEYVNMWKNLFQFCFQNQQNFEIYFPLLENQEIQMVEQLFGILTHLNYCFLSYQDTLQYLQYPTQINLIASQNEQQQKIIQFMEKTTQTMKVQIHNDIITQIFQDIVQEQIIVNSNQNKLFLQQKVNPFQDQNNNPFHDQNTDQKWFFQSKDYEEKDVQELPVYIQELIEKGFKSNLNEIAFIIRNKESSSSLIQRQIDLEQKIDELKSQQDIRLIHYCEQKQQYSYEQLDIQQIKDYPQYFNKYLLFISSQIGPKQLLAYRVNSQGEIMEDIGIINLSQLDNVTYNIYSAQNGILKFSAIVFKQNFEGIQSNLANLDQIDKNNQNQQQIFNFNQNFISNYEQEELFLDLKFGQIKQQNDFKEKIDKQQFEVIEITGDQQFVQEIGKKIQNEIQKSFITHTIQLKLPPSKQFIEYLESLEQKQIGFKLEGESNQKLSLIGFYHSISQVRNSVIEMSKVNLQNVDQLQLPEYWIDMKGKDYLEIGIETNSKEYQDILDHFKKTVPQIKDVKITRIQNLELWKNYYFYKQKVMRIKNTDKEMKLFHGTRTSNPQQIYQEKEVGFDLRLSSPAGLVGQGIYFTNTANYSYASYCYNLANKRKQLLYAIVLVGHIYNQPNTMKNQRKLPKVPGKDYMYDSCQQGENYIIFDSFQAYPLYLLEYS